MLVMTLMVRDEADIIAATLEHHLAQGVDHILVTDNASVDGTREILEAYAEVAPITVLHDPEHRKQQTSVVTVMARRACTELGADWVINGDADEFLRPVDPTRTLRDVMAEMPRALTTFTVPVTNLIGPIGRSGSGLRRLVVRDERDEEHLRRAGVHAHPTPNAIHVGHPSLEVSQGNHFTSLEQEGEVPAGLKLEVLHLPWRSVSQFERKTRAMALGYEANPILRPSANHHGMRDWRRLKAGALLPFLAVRMPTTAELETPGFRRDDSLVRSLEALDALLPDRLALALDDAADDVLGDEEILGLRDEAIALARLDEVAQDEIVRLREEVDQRIDELAAQHDRFEDEIGRHRSEAYAEGVEALRADLQAIEADRDRVVADRDRLAVELDRVAAHRSALAARVEALEAHPVVRVGLAVRRRLRRD